MNNSESSTPRNWVAALAVLAAALICNSATAQPVITNIYPNGAFQFQSSATLAFQASSAAGITNVRVQLTSMTLSGQSSFRNLTPASGLTITGDPTSKTITATLKSNFLYAATIQVWDGNGVSTTTNLSFDTIVPAYTWEAEDWDYTSTGVSGLYIDNPQTNAYAGLATTDGVDAHNSNGGGAYRPVGTSTQPGGLATEQAGDIPRIQYLGTGNTNVDYDVGFTDGGDFGNYTRHYPAGTYNIYMRGSDGGGQAADSASVSVVGGSAFLSASGTVSVPNVGGWQAYSWVPFKDSAGNLITVTFDGSPATLRVLTDGGSYNANFYMLLPTNAVSTGAASDAVVTNVYPDGAIQFQKTNIFEFTVNSSLGVDPGNVIVQLNATNLAGAGSSSTLQNGSGLTITGASTSLKATATLTSNMLYTAIIQVTDANGNGAAKTVTFDTISPTAYTVEAEDWDYNGGQYFDNPQTNAYQGPGTDGISGVDFNCPGGNPHNAYFRLGLNTEGCGDVPRAAYVNSPPNYYGFPSTDFDVGYTAGGQWANYTRHYPAGVYNIYVRAARGDGGNITDASSVSLVTSGYGTDTQTTSLIGKYNVPSTGNWQKYVWCPVLDNGGNLARFVADGSPKTLRVTMDGAGHNHNFYLFVPTDLSQSPPPYVSSFYPDGSQLFQFTNKLTFVVSSSVGIDTNNVTLNLDGTTVAGLVFGGTSNALQVSYPVSTNAAHTAIITMADSAGISRYTNSFTTYGASNYQWEAEDYDYGGGQYFDNLIDAYSGLAPVSGVDCYESDPNGANGSFVYRPSPSGALAIPAGTGDVGGELPRAQFTSGGGTGIDYSIGYFGPNSWANYTRHYPAGTYNVAVRVAEGNAPTEDILYRVTSGVGTANQTTNMLGTFYIPLSGWSSWRWTHLVDASGNPAVITLDGSATTLRLGGSLLGHDEANVNFLMLVPMAAPANPVTLQATSSNGNVVLSFMTQSSFNYQVQFKASLTDPTWTPLGAPVAGDGSLKTVNDPTGGSTRFYRVNIQPAP